MIDLDESEKESDRAQPAPAEATKTTAESTQANALVLLQSKEFQDHLEQLHFLRDTMRAEVRQVKPRICLKCWVVITEEDINNHLKAQGHVGMAILVEVSAFPWLSVVGLGMGYLAGASSVLFPGFATVGSAALVCSVVLWRLPNITWRPITQTPAGQLSRAKDFLYSHWEVLAVYWTSGSLVMISSRMTGLVAPIFLLPSEAGFVAALVGIASLGGTIIAAAQAYFAPRFSALHGAQDTSALTAELRLSQVVVGGIFSLIAIPVMLFPENTLSLFGNEAVTFPTNLLIFATAAQLVRCFTGCSEIFLTMTSKSGLESVTLILAILTFWMTLIFGGDPGLDQFVYAYCAMLATRGVFSYIVAIYELRRDQLR